MSRTFPTIPSIKGYPIKPSSTTSYGIVQFTDGTNNNITPNQQQCEAYGYTFDKVLGVCRAFTPQPLIESTGANMTNDTRGPKNTVRHGVSNTYIMGQENTAHAYSRNNIIVGSENEANNNIYNSATFGMNGRSRCDGELAVGGGANTCVNGDLTTFSDRQVSIVNLTGCTEDNTTTSLTANGLGGFIPVKNNSIIGWEIYITRLEVGGSSGTAGNFSYRNEKGVVRIDNSYSMTFTIGFTRNIGKLGVNGTFAMADTSTTDVKSISIQVSDRNNVHNIWSATVYLHEIISTSVTF
jgi:hypothetical protein